VQVMHEYVGHCQWSPEGAKLWQMMEYLIPRPIEFQSDELLQLLGDFPHFAECCLPSETLARRVADNVVRLGYWPELTPALEGMYEMRRKSSRSQGAGRIAGLLLWNNPYKRIAVEECATALIREDLWRLNAAWKALFLNLPPWAQKPTLTWRKAAEKRLACVGEGDFEEQTIDWLGRLRVCGPLSIQAAGAEMLKSLCWYSILVPRAPLHCALVEFRGVEWNAASRRLADKVQRALLEVPSVRSHQ